MYTVSNGVSFGLIFGNGIYLNDRNVPRRIESESECNDIEPRKQRPTLFHFTKRYNAFQHDREVIFTILCVFQTE